MAADEIQKRRRFRRRTLRVEVEYAWDEGVRHDYATTLGAGGLFIETEEPLPEGALLKLAFTLPSGELYHEISGVVAWAHEPAVTARGSCGMGVAFKDRTATAKLARDLGQLPD
jgi:uncharacterized protein (TIGR02266 family)